MERDKGSRFVRAVSKPNPGLEAVWVPMMLARSFGERCFYAFYCFPKSLGSLSIFRLLTFTKIPEDLVLTDDPGEAEQSIVKWECSDIDLKEDLERALRLAREAEKHGLDHLEWGSLALSHVLSPLIIRRRLEKISSDLSGSIAASMLEEMIYLLTVRLDLREVFQAYILHLFDLKRKRIMLIVNEKLLINKALSHILFKNKDLLELFSLVNA